jgi:hypothetical protein
VLAAIHNPPAGTAKGFLWFYFVNEQLLRYLGKRYPADYGTVAIVLFYGLLFIWFLPWSSFLPQALAHVRLRLPRVASVRRSHEAVLLLLFCWAAVILLFFSFSTRQEYYLAPTLPAFALLLGNGLACEAEAPIGSPVARSGRISATVLLAVGLVAAVAAITFALISHAPSPGVELADLLNSNAADSDVYKLSMGHFLDLTGNAMSLFRVPLIGTALAFSVGPLLNWLFRRRGKTQAANWVLVGMIVVFLECVHISIGVFAPVLGSKPLAVAIERQLQPGEQIICDGEYANASSVNFYTRQEMYILNGRINGLWYGSLFPDAPQIFLDNKQFAQMWTGPGRVYFVTGDEKKKGYLEKLGAFYPLAKAGGKFVFSNRPSNANLEPERQNSASR